jgi:hypothetical protein
MPSVVENFMLVSFLSDAAWCWTPRFVPDDTVNPGHYYNPGIDWVNKADEGHDLRQPFSIVLRVGFQ